MLSRMVRYLRPATSLRLLQIGAIKATNMRPTTPSKNIVNVYTCRLFSQQTTPEPVTVDFIEVKKATTDNKTLLVDVREPDEVKEHGKIPNSINIPLGNVTTALSTMSEKDFKQTYGKPKPSEDTPIIFYCMIGKRSGKAQQNALNLGFKNAKNYLGSYNDWASKNQ